jgi:hypothetical protein
MRVRNLVRRALREFRAFDAADASMVAWSPRPNRLKAATLT